jgi:hypothetical protein
MLGPLDVGDGDERDLDLHVDSRGVGVIFLLLHVDGCLTHVILLLLIEVNFAEMDWDH